MDKNINETQKKCTLQEKQEEEVQYQKVTITPKDGDIGMRFEAAVLLHYHDIDGSQILVLKTIRRKSVEKFLHDEIVGNSTA